MSQTIKMTLLVGLTAAGIYACQPSSFNSGSTPRGGVTAADRSTIGRGSGNDPKVELNPSDKNRDTCVDKIPAVHVVIAVDKSGSMSSELKGVREGLHYFTQKLRTKELQGFGKPIIDLKFSLIGYEDEINNSGGPWNADDPNLQKTLDSWFAKVNSLGSDAPEGGIMAVREALKKISAQSVGSVNVVVLITDAFSHDGGGRSGHRLGGFSSLDSYFMRSDIRPLMIFSSTSGSRNGSGNFDDDTDKNFKSGKEQIEGLRQHYRAVANIPAAFVGQEFIDVRSFSNNTLGDLVADMVGKNITKCP